MPTGASFVILMDICNSPMGNCRVRLRGDPEAEVLVEFLRFREVRLDLGDVRETEVRVLRATPTAPPASPSS